MTPSRSALFASPEAAIESLNHRTRATPEGVWTYLDAFAEPVLKVIRYEMRGNGDDSKSKPGKTFRPIGRVGESWVIGDPPGQLPLYHLPELLRSQPGDRIFVTEGEKSADAGTSCGLLVTTSAHGAKSAAKSDWSAVKGRDVVILPDRDEAGAYYADDVTELALEAGAHSVCLVRLWDRWPELPAGGDLADLLDFNTPDSIRQGLEELVRFSQPEEPPRVPGRLAYEPFPVHALPGPIAQFVESAAGAIGCDPAMVALPVLSVLAGSIGCSRSLVVKESWHELPILWTAVVADSGQAKTPAFAAALQPLRQAQRARMQDAAGDLERYEREKSEYERAYAQWKRLKSNVGPPSKPTPPRAERLIISDQTIEAVADRLKDNPRGLLLEREELAGWIGSFDRYSNTRGGDVAHWLTAWSGGQMLVDRKTGQQTILIARATLSVCGTIQPGTLARILGTQHQDNGLAPRMLFAMPPARPTYWSDRIIEPAVAAKYASIVEDLLSLQMLETSDGLEPCAVRLDPLARKALRDIHDEFVDLTRGCTGVLAAAASKLKACLARLTLIIHLVRVVSGDRSITDECLADDISVSAAADLVWWFWREAQRIYDRLGESDAEAEDRQLLEWIERRGCEVSVRDLTHGLRQFRGRTDAAKSALDKLVQSGLGEWIRARPVKQGGRPSERFRLIGGLGIAKAESRENSPSYQGSQQDPDQST